ncbi:ATP-binding protein [Actinacidiphila yeochonensis]|uniref:ATP-binding protein n=1 Tax=Actinacidiphila yeochonensis TaxID=89050 RepID=UPI0006897D30|nr:ATP-binding protein [Actinacidiphila yeochonensis]
MTLGDGPLISSLDLTPELSSVREARRYVTATLQDWQVPTATAEDAVTIVSELVANAVRHAEPASAVASTAKSPEVAACTVVLELRTDSVCVFVCDQDRRPPVLQHPSLEAEGGRGLRLVDELSESWGYVPRGHAPGKTVWAEVVFSEHLEPPRSGALGRLRPSPERLIRGGRSCDSAGEPGDAVHPPRSVQALPESAR